MCQTPRSVDDFAPPISRLPRYRHKAVYRTLTGLAEVYRPVVGEQIPPIRAKRSRRLPSQAIGGSRQRFNQSQPVSFTSAKIKKGVPILAATSLAPSTTAATGSHRARPDAAVTGARTVLCPTYIVDIVDIVLNFHNHSSIGWINIS